MSRSHSIPRVILLFGPTAVGKTRLLFRLFGEGYEVINADSMQVYRGMDIGTAKPSPQQRRRIPHHLIDIRNPNEQYTVGDFVRDADEAVRAIVENAAVPILSGGTAFYFRNFIFGLPETPPSDPVVRDRLRDRLEREGSEALHEELASVDPVAAVRIAANDGYRVTRALEIFQLTGRGVSEHSVPDAPRGDIETLTVGLTRDREILHERIEARVNRMFAEGLPEEVAALRAAGYGPGDPGMRAIGYREFFEFDDPDTIRRRIVVSSRQYAKRQMTFFKRLPGVEWVDAEDFTSVARLTDRFLSKRNQ